MSNEPAGFTVSVAFTGVCTARIRYQRPSPYEDLKKNDSMIFTNYWSDWLPPVNFYRFRLLLTLSVFFLMRFDREVQQMLLVIKSTLSFLKLVARPRELDDNSPRAVFTIQIQMLDFNSKELN